MNEPIEPQKLETSNQCWPAIGRGMKKGVKWGAIVTVGIQIVCMIGGSGTGENFIALILLVPWSVNVFPAWVIYQIFGLAWHGGENCKVTIPVFFLMVVINSILSALFGGLFAWAGWKRNIKI